MFFQDSLENDRLDFATQSFIFYYINDSVLSSNNIFQDLLYFVHNLELNNIGFMIDKKKIIFLKNI